MSRCGAVEKHIARTHTEAARFRERCGIKNGIERCEAWQLADINREGTTPFATTEHRAREREATLRCGDGDASRISTALLRCDSQRAACKDAHGAVVCEQIDFSTIGVFHEVEKRLRLSSHIELTTDGHISARRVKC